MKNYKLLLLCVISLLQFNYSLLAQEKNKIENSYEKYFELEKEIPYLHLNKTSFFKGEKIWFKAYVLNLNTQKLNYNTRNLYCSIYDEKGNLKYTKMLLVQQGLASGFFEVDETFTDKVYYIKSSTNYMKNFQEDESFIQKIQILNNQNNAELTTASDEIDNRDSFSYNIQVVPEGGSLLANSINTIGVALKYGVTSQMVKSARVIEGKKEIIDTYHFDQNGNSKVQFFITKGKKYKTEIILNDGTKIIEPISYTKIKGVNLAVNNVGSNMVEFIVRTNEETVNDLVGKEYYIFVHNTNSYLKKNIKFKKEAIGYSIFLNRKLFRSGTNIVTLFNDKDEPVAERTFFNYDRSILKSLNLEVAEEENDSIVIDVSKIKSDKDVYFLSASILPTDTKANSPKNDIYSNFLIKPFVNQELNDIDDYLNDTNRKKLTKLDMIMLNQANSKYKWFNIMNNSPKELFDYEKGITIKGVTNIEEPQDFKNVFLLSRENDLLRNTTLESEAFEFKNLYLLDTTTINFSFSDKKFLKEPKVYIRSYPIFKDEKIEINNEETISTKKVKGQLELTQVSDDFVTSNSEILKEVEVKARKVKFENRPLTLNLVNGIKINKNFYARKTPVLSFIRSQGFSVSDHPFGVKISHSMSPRSGVRIFLDDFEISNNSNMLLGLRFKIVEEFSEIFISNFNDEIYLYSSDFSYIPKTRICSNIPYKVPYGFSKEEAYVGPRYASTSNELFKSYGAIHWESYIELDEKDSFKIKFPRLDQKEVKVYIQGITKDGSLVSYEKILNLDTNELR